VRVVERRPAAELSGTGAVGELGAGVLIGGGLFAATLAVLWLLGYLRVSGAVNWSVLGAALAVDAAGAVVEELLLRGILFRITEEAAGTWIALAVSVVVFGLLHAGGAASSPAATVVVALAGGLLPGAAYVLRRRLWIPIGIHAGWDFVQDIILGVTLAGHQVPGLVRAQITGPGVVTGGGMGPEGSLVALVLCLAVSIALLARAARHGGIVKPFWRRVPQAAPATT
jgi:membrane protease YdiL (CAAX protease family)